MTSTSQQNTLDGRSHLWGFAASRAESLRLSVEPTILLAALPPEAKPLISNVLTESQRLSAQEEAEPQCATQAERSLSHEIL